MQLTVAIPTYDRPVLLARSVEALLPQLTADCRLLILDNCSPTPAEDVVRPLLDTRRDIAARVVRHRVNIGGNSNILRCVEMCETEWVWTLGDDDLVRPDAVATVLRRIRENPGHVFINFALPTPARPADLPSVGCGAFVRSIDATRHVTLISNDVFNVGLVERHLKQAQNFTYSYLPHVALALAAIGREGAALLARDTIIDGNAENVGNPGWSIVDVMIGVTALLELPMESATQRDLAGKLLAGLDAHRAVTLCLAARGLASGDIARAVFLYDAYAARSFYFARWPTRVAKAKAYRLLVRFPRLTRRLLRRFLPSKIEWFDRMARHDPLERV